MDSEKSVPNAQELQIILQRLIRSSDNNLSVEQIDHLQEVVAQFDVPLDILESPQPSLTRYAESQPYTLPVLTPKSIEQFLGSPITSTSESFTVTPIDKGGQVLSKGTEFQDIYTIFLLTKFLDKEEPAVLLRIEGAEDIDLIVKQKNGVCERYYQVKTVAEGRNWTLSDCKGIWWRFAQELSEFKTKNTDPTRSIQFFLVVDGDVSEDLAPLKRDAADFCLFNYPQNTVVKEKITTVRASAFTYILVHMLHSRYSNIIDKSKSKEFWGQFDNRFAILARVLDHLFLIHDMSDRISPHNKIVSWLFDSSTPQESLDKSVEQELEKAQSLLKEIIVVLQAQGLTSPKHLEILRNSIIDAYISLDSLLPALTIESRLGFGIKTLDEEAATDRLQEYYSPLIDATVRQFVRGSYLSDSQAELAYKKLKDFVQKARSVGGIIDAVRFNLLLPNAPRVQLETIPESEGHVHREELINRIEKELDSHQAIELCGFPKVGKTSIVAMVAKKYETSQPVFWYTADSDGIERFIRQFTFFVGQLQNSKNLHDDWLEKKLSYRQAAKITNELLQNQPLLIILDNCEAFDDSQAKIAIEFLTQVISEERSNIKVITIKERVSTSSSLTLTDMTQIDIGGLNVKESVVFLKQLGCIVTEENSVDFISLITKIDGHPHMLRTVASQLQGEPTSQAVSRLANELFDLNQETSLFFDNLWSRIERLLTPRQMEVFYRLSLLFPFDRELCFVVAQCKPTIELTANDWRRLKIHVLEPRYDHNYEVPRLFKELSTAELTNSLKQTVYTTAANHILQKQPLDVLEFQNGILYHIRAGNWEEAAQYFIWAHNSENVPPYDYLEFLYAIFRGTEFQNSGLHPLVKFSIVFVELTSLLAEPMSSSTKQKLKRVFKSLKRSLRLMEPTQASEALSEVVWQAYQRFTRYYPEEETVFDTLHAHFTIVEELQFSEFRLIISLAIGTYYLERIEDYKNANDLCTHILSESKSHLDSKLKTNVLALRADSLLSQKNYKFALIDYLEAANLRPEQGAIAVLDFAIQECIGDCHWQLGNFRSAAAAYLKALKLRRRILSFDQKRSFRLFGKLSAVYFFLKDYLNSINLHAKMFSMYLRFQDETMLVIIGGSLQSILSQIPGSHISADRLNSISTIEYASPIKMGPTFYNASIQAEGDVLEKWLRRTSPAMLCFLLSKAFDAAGDVEQAIDYCEFALSLPHETNFSPKPELHFLAHLQLADLHLKNGNKLTSAKEVFDALSLTERYLKSQADPLSDLDLPYTEEFQKEIIKHQRNLKRFDPYDVARPTFRSHIEPVILSEIKRKSGFNKQVKYFLALAEMAEQLPSSIAGAIEAWVQMYCGMFFLTRDHPKESNIAFERMNELIEGHDLTDVKLHYSLHTTFSLTPLLYPTLADFAEACVATAKQLCEQLPKYKYLFSDFNERFIFLWSKSIEKASDLQPSDPLRKYSEKLEQLKSTITHQDNLFYHIVAMLTVFLVNIEADLEDARFLQSHFLLQPLNQLDTDDLCYLYNDYSKFSKAESQKAILSGNIEKGEKLATELAKILSFEIEQYENKLSKTQLKQLENDLQLANLWSSSNLS